MTHRLRNDLAAFLTGQPNQIRNSYRFFEHDLFPEEMMRSQGVSVVARMHDHGIVTQAESFQAREDGTDALIDQRDQPEVSLFDAFIFVRGDPKKKLAWQAFPVQIRFRLLPLSHELVAQRNIVGSGSVAVRSRSTSPSGCSL